MVNSNVIRGGGLIILAGCYVAVERAFTNNVVNDATNLHVDLVGADRGSMYNVSFVASKLMPVVIVVVLVSSSTISLPFLSLFLK
jgi:hypothetical protein